MKKNNGITLIALVVTIIVLLILAGVSIAMLTGQNGILGNAQDSSTYNAYYGAEEQVKLAYMAVRTEIMSQVVKDGTYDATDNSTDKKHMDALKGVVEKDLNGSEWAVDIDENKKIIKITYSDTSIDQGKIGNKSWVNATFANNTVFNAPNAVTQALPLNEGHVNYAIHLTAQDATLHMDLADAAW